MTLTPFFEKDSDPLFQTFFHPLRLNTFFFDGTAVAAAKPPALAGGRL